MPVTAKPRKTANQPLDIQQAVAALAEVGLDVSHDTLTRAIHDGTLAAEPVQITCRTGLVVTKFQMTDAALAAYVSGLSVGSDRRWTTMADLPRKPKFRKLDDVIAETGLSDRWLRKRIQQGLVGAIRTTRRYQMCQEDIDAAIALARAEVLNPSSVDDTLAAERAHREKTANRRRPSSAAA
jgi:hypothetical protein